jgi:hypothetical protein
MGQATRVALVSHRTSAPERKPVINRGAASTSQANRLPDFGAFHSIEKLQHFRRTEQKRFRNFAEMRARLPRGTRKAIP